LVLKQGYRDKTEGEKNVGEGRGGEGKEAVCDTTIGEPGGKTRSKNAGSILPETH